MSVVVGEPIGFDDHNGSLGKPLDQRETGNRLLRRLGLSKDPNRMYSSSGQGSLNRKESF